MSHHRPQSSNGKELKTPLGIPTTVPRRALFLEGIGHGASEKELVPLNGGFKLWYKEFGVEQRFRSMDQYRL